MWIVVYFKIVWVLCFLLKIFMFSEFYTIAFIKKNKKAVCPLRRAEKWKPYSTAKKWSCYFLWDTYTHILRYKKYCDQYLKVRLPQATWDLHISNIYVLFTHWNNILTCPPYPHVLKIPPESIEKTFYTVREAGS